ncbi:MAG: hypothetical protein ACE5JM_04300, partial [Armatimonadota bacterium]
TIDSDGQVTEWEESESVEAAALSREGPRPVLTCPKCSRGAVSFWSNPEFYRAVCHTCELLLEAKRDA